MAEVYKVPLVPGPTTVPQYVREQYLTDFGSADLEDSYFELYAKTGKNLQKVLGTQNKIVIMSGECMVALWGAMKSVLKAGDRVMAVSSGLFGDGFAEMATSIGCEALLIRNDDDNDAPSEKEIMEKAKKFKPKLITFVLCETPAGIINDIIPVTKAAKEVGALLLVDYVSIAGSIEIKNDEWGIDLGLIGSQKCLSCLPDLGIVAVSDKAWKVANEIKYTGYDAIIPFEHALENKSFPYTPNWHALSALNTSLEHLFKEGLKNVFKRHKEVAKHTRDEILKLGLKLYPKREEHNSPTVTAVYVPEGWTWDELDKALREKGVVVGGTYGDLVGKVFRIGHMGSQAQFKYVDAAIEALREILQTKK